MNAPLADLPRTLRELTPIVEARVARLLRRRRPDGRDTRQELPDLVQQVFVALLENDARILRTWAPERGMSLENFVGLVAEREVLSIFRSGRRTPFDRATEELPETLGDSTLDARTLSKELLMHLVDQIRTELSPQGLVLFERIVVQEEPPATIASSLGMSLDAIYAWRSRLLRRLRAIASELHTEGPHGATEMS